MPQDSHQRSEASSLAQRRRQRLASSSELSKSAPSSTPLYVHRKYDMMPSVQHTDTMQAAQAKDAYNKADSKISAYASDASKKLEETRKDVGSNLMAGVDKFDKTVEKKAAETKGWLGGWFGGK